MAAVRPRYTVGSVTGYAINARSLNASRYRPQSTQPVTWYVHDALHNYAIVAEITTRNGQQRAEKLAAKLNAEYEHALCERGDL